MNTQHLHSTVQLTINAAIIFAQTTAQRLVRVRRMLWFIIALFLLSLNWTPVSAQPAMIESGNPTPTESHAVQAELIWVAFDGKQFNLMHNQFTNSAWGDPSVIYQTQNPITTPTLNRTAAGATSANIAVWTEQRTTKTVLMHASKLTDNEWSLATILHDRNSDNFAPHLTLDLAGNLWMFWSASDEGPSEIYYKVKTFDGWSAAKQVNEANKVPDLTPKARALIDGSVTVSWNTYSASATQYIETSQNLSLISSDANAEDAGLTLEPEYQDPVAAKDIPLPSYLPDNALYTLFLAPNRLAQVKVLP